MRATSPPASSAMGTDACVGIHSRSPPFLKTSPFLVHFMPADRPSEIQVPAEHLALLRRVALVDAPRLGVARHRRRHRDQRAFGDAEAVADGGVDAEER